MQRNTYTLTGFLLLAGLCITALVNSCKKDDATPLKDYLTNHGTWKLASLQVYHFKRYTATTTDTPSVSCGKNLQTFSFTNVGGSNCSYQYYQCNSTVYSGTWSLDTDSLILHANILMPDTAAKNSTGKSHPFIDAQIINLGGSSLVLKTGDIKSYYPDDKVHTYYRYAFIHDTTTVH